MDWNFQQLKYGWYALVGVILTGTTIYVVNNQRQQINPVDIIELVLGTTERCLATQYATNPSYYVSPFSYISNYKDTNYTLPGIPFGSFRLFTPVCYTTYWPDATARIVSYTNYFPFSSYQLIRYASSYTATGGYVWTTGSFVTFIQEPSAQTVTNLIDYMPNRAMMASLDVAIYSLIPNKVSQPEGYDYPPQYYCDKNTVYDGTTNIQMLSRNKLFKELNIGSDVTESYWNALGFWVTETNRYFTRSPAWTNLISTNWIVNYTSYWPSTSGVATNICYTSDYRQAVNYAQSWTATGGHVWVSASNWESVVVIITNQATYGDYPWQIYAEDLEERYKVLNALKYTSPTLNVISENNSKNAIFYSTNSLADAKMLLENWWASNSAANVYVPYPITFSTLTLDSSIFGAGAVRTFIRYTIFISTNITSICKIWAKGNIYNTIYDSQGDGILENKFISFESEDSTNGMPIFTIGQSEYPLPSWPDSEPPPSIAKGYQVGPYPGTDKIRAIADWNFQYCTNKYW